MTTGVPSVGQALDSVVAWKEGQLNENLTKIGEVNGELAKLRDTLANLQEQLVSLEKAKEQLEAINLDSDLISRSYDAVFDALRKQSGMLSQRTAQVATAENTRREAAYEELSAGPLAPLVDEFKQFKETVEPTLVALPESYRAAISQHHDGVSEKIRNFLVSRLAGHISADSDALELDLVYAVDAPDGKAEVLICVLPIPHETFADWSGRPTDLGTLIGARVAQAIYETTKTTGPRGAQAISGGHQGLLAMEVDLEGSADDFETVFVQRLEAVLAAAPEIVAAKVQIKPKKVDFDFLLPPDDSQEDE